MAGDQAQFYQLLNTILSIDNETRSQAEKLYNDIPTETKVVHLVGAIQNADLGEEARETAAVLLRRLLSAEFFEFFPKLPFDQQAMLREQLLLTLQMDVSQQLRRKICDVVSELARNHIDDDGVNQWPEFLQFMFNCASAQDPNIKEAGIRMFTSVPGVFGNRQNENLDVIKRMLLSTLQPTESEALQMQAVKAVGAFILLHDKEPAIQKHFSDLLVPFMQVVVQSIEKADDDAALKVLIELAESAPKFLRPQVQTIFQVCIKVIGDKDGEDNWRQLALEALVTLCETAPAMVRKVVPNAIQLLTPLILDMMCELEEEPDWAVQDNASDDDNELNYVAAESALDRMCCGLGGKIMLGLIVGQVPEMLNSQDWKRRHAALMAVSSAGEGCHKQMEQMLDQVVSAVLNYLTDPHPRVRYAACNAVGQMSTDFAPVFEKKFHDKVVPGLLMVLEDNAHPRVQAHAAAALVNFSEDCPKQILTQYLGPLMGKLEAILTAKFKELVESGTKLVLEQIVTTIASVADTVEKEFVEYYDRLMPCLKYIIANATTDEFKMLRGKTIECVSLIGLAVGEEKFMADASEVMDMLLKTHSEGDQLPADDPQTSYLISAWSRICRIMGKKFAQYLPMVMEPVMRTAAMKPEVALLDNDDLEIIEGELDWHFVTLGEQQNFGIKTAGLEDKASACDMLVCYARELKEAFAEYAEDVVKLMVPMLKFYFHDNVRTAAAESLPYLLECARIRGPQYIQGMWAYILPELLKAIESDPEQDVQVELLNSLAKCIELLGTGCLSDESMSEVLRILNKLLAEHFERATQRRQRLADEDYDEVVEEQLADEDNEDVYGLSRVADVLHALMSAYHENFYPHLDSLVPYLVQLLGPGRPYADRQWAICIFDDVIEFGGPACVKYQDVFLEPMLNGLREPQPEVRQAAAYGCGVLAQFGGPNFAAACARAVPLLAALIAEPDSRSVENLNATENAISAVTKIIKYNHSQINRDEIIRHWLTWLPVVEDTEEAPHVYSLLCELAAGGHPALATPDAPRHVIATLAEAFLRDAVPNDNPVYAQMVALVRQIQTNAELFNSCLMQLSNDHKEALKVALLT
ncbi:importin-5 [Danaus plexippus]|uniref:Karyopherin beta 3 n=1 Tax=Danaus plexippus plexippus TaxID=278856 RepID=A0A212F003_DANPL|nr:importin-5 [Danaus plexippus]OWR47024.1 Karyopherin beta 3 [Danaus plexippus plexippus]